MGIEELCVLNCVNSFSPQLENKRYSLNKALSDQSLFRSGLSYLHILTTGLT